MAQWPYQYDAFFKALDWVRECGVNSWDAKCPSHDDNKPSLSIKIGSQGKLIFRCHAGHGCTQEGILGALQLTWDDCFPDSRPAGGSAGEHQQATRKLKGLKFVESYPYRYEDGSLAYEVVRYIDQDVNKKTFRQRRPNPKFDHRNPSGSNNREWIADMHGVRLVLFMLPELLAALKEKPDRYVFVVEGEKDVKNLRRIRITATTSPQGAGKWHVEYNQAFAGANVVVIPDEDPVDPNTGRRQGLDHARTVCDNLKPVANSVRMVRLWPEGDRDKKLDTTDWLEITMKGKTVKEIQHRLFAIVKSTPEWVSPETSSTPSANPSVNGHPVDLADLTLELLRCQAHLNLALTVKPEWDQLLKRADEMIDVLQRMKECR